MPALARQKACLACAESKRKCDKQLPECQRCLDRDVDCVYPVSRRRRDRGAAMDRVKDLPAPQDHLAIGNDMDFDFVFADWNGFDRVGIDLDLRAPPPGETTSFEYVQPGSQSLDTEPASDLSLPDAPVPWFLQEETWIKGPPAGDGAGCATSAQLEPFVQTARNMLNDWVRQGHNVFIHRRLYKKGMHPCLQDAFTTMATYITCTATTKEMIMQIAEDRLCLLAGHRLTPAIQVYEGILDRIAHVQALYVYLFILLFDGVVWRRASAEKHLSVLRHWTIQMWESVRQYKGESASTKTQTLRWAVNGLNNEEYNADAGLWEAWILTESARRTHLIVDSFSNVYDLMIKGRATCSGGVMFTAARGLWDAESAAAWSALCSTKTLLMVPSLQPELFMSHYAADEFDDLVTLIWAFILGADKIKDWVDRSRLVRVDGS